VSQNEISVLSWRVTRGIPSGVHIWFDPERESVRLFRVPTSEQRCLGNHLHDGLAGEEEEVEVDNFGSVSGPESEGELPF